MGSVNVVKPPCLQIAWSANKYLVVRFVLVASCAAGVDADQVVESVAGFEGRVWRVATVRESYEGIHTYNKYNKYNKHRQFTACI